MYLRKLVLAGLLSGAAAVSVVGPQSLVAQESEAVPVCSPTTWGYPCGSAPDPTDCTMINGTLYCRIVYFFADGPWVS